MSTLRLPALLIALALLFIAGRTVFAAPARQVTTDNLQISGQTGFALSVALPDGTTLTVPVNLQIVTQVQNGSANMDVTTTVGEGASASVVPILNIPAAIESSRSSMVMLPALTNSATNVTANRNANLRQGPGTNYAVVGSARTGEALEVVGQNDDGTWLQLADGAWIAAFLVTGWAGGTQAPTVVAPSRTIPQAVATQAPLPTETSAPTPTPIPPMPEPQEEQAQSCDPSYPDFCLAPGIPDLDCPDIPQYARFRVFAPDPHGFDGNHDGVGCESN